MSDLALWKRLESELAQRVGQFPGVAGLCLYDLTTERQIALNANEIFPTASSIKVPVLLRVLQLAEQGVLDLHELIYVPPNAIVGGSGVLGHLEGYGARGLPMSRLDVAILMIIVSDNTATNLCIEWCGRDSINAMLDELGLPHTRLNRKLMDLEAARRNEDNLSTPAELVRLFTLLYEGQPSAFIAEKALAILQKPKSGMLEKALPLLEPPALANKPGAIGHVRCDAGLVLLPKRPYAVAIMTKFGLCAPDAQEQWVVETARVIYATMAALDTSNAYGNG
ncbi:MAG: serine hydrolase [Caldilineaceae bacterium]